MAPLQLVFHALMPKILRPIIAVLIALLIVGISAAISANSKEAVSFLVALGFLVGAGLWVYWQNANTSRMLNEWARENGYRIVSREYRSLLRGRFWWRTSKSQRVYYIDVVDAEGNHRTGYARLGNWFLGMLVDEVSVEWDRPDALYGPKGFPVTIVKGKEHQ
jgi:hypothetical protein